MAVAVFEDEGWGRGKTSLRNIRKGYVMNYYSAVL